MNLKYVRKDLKHFIIFCLQLIIFVANFSCALSQQQELIAEQYEKQKKREQRQLRNTYYVKIVCPEDAEKYVGAKYLDFPYSIELMPGKSVDFIIYYPDTGIKYGGELFGMAEDKEGFGKYPGYELCLNDALLREADAGEKVVFYLRSPKGELMVRVTIWRSR